MRPDVSHFKADLIMCALVALMCGAAILFFPRLRDTGPDYADVQRLSDTTPDTGLATEQDESDADNAAVAQELACLFDADVKMINLPAITTP